jgi:hypothetical protein
VKSLNIVEWVENDKNMKGMTFMENEMENM